MVLFQVFSITISQILFNFLLKLRETVSIGSKTQVVGILVLYCLVEISNCTYFT